MTNAMIPLSLKGIDPSGVPNALLQGMQLRQSQRAGDAAMRKEEAEQASTNALRTYGGSARGPEDLNALWATDPTMAAGIEKTQGAAALNTARTATATAQGEKAKIEVALQELELGSQYLAGVHDEPSYQEGLEQSRVAGLDVSQAPSKYFPDWVEQKKQQGLSAKEQYQIRLKELDQSATQGRFEASQSGIDERFNASQMGMDERQQRAIAATDARPDAFDQNMQRAGIAPGSPEYAAAAREKALGAGGTPMYDAQGNVTGTLGGRGKALTEGQGRTGMLEGEAQHADSAMRDLESAGYNPTGARALFDKVTAEGGVTTNWLSSAEGQTYTSAAKEFVASVGYGKSGANLSENEWETGRQTYIPQVGDSKQRLEFKASARAKAMQGMKIQAGPALQSPGTPSRANQGTPAQAGSGITQIKNASDYANLRSGEEFLTPKGERKRKR